MTVNYTTNLALGQPVTGTESGTWGDDVNNSVTSYLDIAISGSLALTSASFTANALTLANTQGNSSATNIGVTTAQYYALRISSLAANVTITAPSVSKTYLVVNSDSTYSVTVKASGQPGVSVIAGESATVYYNGTDYIKVTTSLAAVFGNLLFPIGAIYTATVATNPGTLLGFGTWATFGSGRMLISQDATYTAGSTGGSATTTLITANLPSHTHTFTGSALATHTHQIGSRDSTANDGGGSAQGFVNDFGTGGGAPATTSAVSGGTPAGTISNTGSGTAVTTISPYIAVYMWQRTA